MKKHDRHVYGTNMINQQETLCYVHIPKCASTSLVRFLSLNRWHAITDPIKGVPAFAVIREPYSRYISGLRSCWDRKMKYKMTLDKWVRGIKKVEAVDEHLEKQISFLLPFLTDLKYIVTLENLDQLKVLNLQVDTYENKGDEKLIDVIRENLKLTKKEILEFYSEDNYLYNKYKGEVIKQ